MKPYVFNIGFNRSGTTSLTAALNLLNIKTLHYRSINNILLEKLILKNQKRNKKLFYTLDQKYQGFSDFTGEEHYQILYKQYSDSKFIFTTRPFLDWLYSYMILMMAVHPNLFKDVESEKFFYNRAIHIYFDIGTEIRNFFKDKPDQFLELKICEGEGWEKLCPFLGVDVPDVEFPYKNKTTDTRRITFLAAVMAMKNSQDILKCVKKNSYE